MTGSGAATQLYLVLPASGDAAHLDAQVEAALGAGPIATVLIEPDALSPPPPPELAKAVAAIQKRGIATLLLGDAALARVIKADGVHLFPSKTLPAAYGAARETLGTRSIVGVDVGRSRHDAMELGELGADYIAFGVPPHVEDRETGRRRRLDLVQWWSEIFEVPGIAFDVETHEDAASLAAAGVDFVAVRLPPGVAMDDIGRYLAPFVAALGATAPAS